MTSPQQEEIMSFDVEWETFSNTAENIFPETTFTSPNVATTTMDDDKDPTGMFFSAVQRQPHSSKGGTRKNRKGKEWYDIGRIVKARKKAGKESMVYLNGRLIDAFKLQKNISRPRYMQPFEKYRNTPLPPVPRDFAIRSPQMQGSTPTPIQELPFMQCQTLFRQVAIPHVYPSETSNQISESTLHRTVSTMHRQIVMPKLEAILPALIFHSYTAGSPEGGLRVEHASGAYFDFLCFSVANNFAGLDNLSPQHVLDYLKKQTTTHITHLMQSILGQTGRALAEKLFLCAIEAKDASVVEAILQYKQNTGVDVNGSILDYKGHRYTPVQRSAVLRDIATTRVLLKYGADVNKKVQWRYFRTGALSCALQWGIIEKIPAELELVQLLLEYGASVNTQHLREALEGHTAEVIQAVFHAGAWENHEEWGMKGLFGTVLRALHNEEVAGFISVLKQIGADINAPRDRKHPTMLDVAANQGDFEMVQLLLSSGAVETATTLSYAIRSQETEVIELFLNEENADTLTCDSPPTTPYAEAVRIGDRYLMQALKEKGSLTNINESVRYLAVLDAASEAGNSEVILNVLKIRTDINHRFYLGNALHTAIAAGHGKVATILIHAGANVNTKGDIPLGATPLELALEKQIPELVRIILDFDPNVKDTRYSPLTLAARWGNMSIINDLLVAGCDINKESVADETPLIVAIANRDRSLTNFLLNLGAKVNHTDSTRYGRNTALSTAVSVQDIDMVKDLLSIGADPADPVALFKACEMWVKKRGENEAEMTRLLVGACLKRYPHGNQRSFEATLHHAMKVNLSIPIRETLKPIMDLRFPGYDQYVAELLARAIAFDGQIPIKTLRPFIDSLTNPNAVVPGLMRRIPLLCVAIKAKCVEAVDLLLEKGADVNFPATRGVKYTPIQEAGLAGCYEIVLKLIRRGAVVDAAAAEVGGGTAIQLAAIGGFVGIVDLLIKKGADVNRCPSRFHGRTALEGAAEHGRLDMAQFLLHSGAHTDGPGRQSFLNAMQLAKENGHFAVLELLKSYSE